MESVLLVSGNGRLAALAETLQSLGHRVARCERPSEAEEGGSCSVVVLDGSDPLAARDAAEARLRFPGVTLLALVPSEAVDRVPELLAAGVDDVLGEPVDASSLDLRLMVARRVSRGNTPATAAPTAAHAAPRRVLVIDDEPGILDVVAHMLRGNDVVCTLRAEEALAWIERGERYDLILCDLMMPEMTGMDLHAAVSQRWPEVAERFVFLTGGAFTQRAREFLETVANRRVDKPFRAATLREIVAQA